MTAGRWYIKAKEGGDEWKLALGISCGCVVVAVCLMIGQRENDRGEEKTAGYVVLFVFSLQRYY